MIESVAVPDTRFDAVAVIVEIAAEIVLVVVDLLGKHLRTGLRAFPAIAGLADDRCGPGARDAELVREFLRLVLGHFALPT